MSVDRLKQVDGSLAIDNNSQAMTPQAASPRVIAFTIEELSVGGAEHMLMVMANAFVVRGWQVHVICLTAAGELASGLDESVQLHVLNKKLGFDTRLLWRLYNCVNEIKPDVINSHLWVANSWTRLSLIATNIAIVVTEHSRDTWKPLHYRWVDKFLGRRSYRMVTVSSDTANFYEEVVGIDRADITVINNGVDTARYASGSGTALRKGWLASYYDDTDDKREAILIGSVGRLVTAKNHTRLIDAFAKLANDEALSEHYYLYLKIVGEGPERARIQHYIDDLGLSHIITLAGARHDIPDVLAAFDLFVLSSDREGHPLTALESQAAGTPVVLTDAGGSEEAIARDGDQSGGALVDCDVDQLSMAMRNLIVDSELRAAQSRFARQYALSNFDKKQMIESYESIFLKAIAARL